MKNETFTWPQRKESQKKKNKKISWPQNGSTNCQSQIFEKRKIYLAANKQN